MAMAEEQGFYNKWRLYDVNQERTKYEEHREQHDYAPRMSFRILREHMNKEEVWVEPIFTERQLLRIEDLSVIEEVPEWARRTLFMRPYSPMKVGVLWNHYTKLLIALGLDGEEPHSKVHKRAFFAEMWDKVHPGFKGTRYRELLIEKVGDQEGYWPLSLFCLLNDEQYDDRDFFTCWGSY
jgi:hypothetical protein